MLETNISIFEVVEVKSCNFFPPQELCFFLVWESLLAFEFYCVIHVSAHAPFYQVVFHVATY